MIKMVMYAILWIKYAEISNFQFIDSGQPICNNLHILKIKL